MKKFQKFLNQLGNIAFWTFVAGMMFSIVKGFYFLAAPLLILSVVLFLIFLVLQAILKISKKK